MNINSIHIELTDKCQAACPMCWRNTYGAGERPHIRNVEITLEQFKQWFPKEFLKGLNHFYACGNNGDPLLAHDCLDIFQYIAESSDCSLAIHTNGSLRNKEWWTRAAKVLGSKGKIVFAIDGFKGEHELYRRNTNWDKIIENAKTFIAAGGRAKANTIIFKHNEDRIEELKQFLLDLGFEEVNIKTTQRFFDVKNYPVKNKDGNIEYYIQPPVSRKEPIIKPNFVKLADKKVFDTMLDSADIKPQCLDGYNLFLDPQGFVYPCCSVGSFVVSEIEGVDGPEKIVRQRLKDSAMNLIEDIGYVNLNNTNIKDALANSDWGEKIHNHWTVGNKKFICAKACASNIQQILEVGTNTTSSARFN